MLDDFLQDLIRRDSKTVEYAEHISRNIRRDWIRNDAGYF